MRSVPRLFVEEDLTKNAVVSLPEQQAHYLLRVMRLGSGDHVSAFNGRDGEWLCEISPDGRKSANLRCLKRVRVPSAPSDIWLLFSPLKVKARMSYCVEKAVELGAAKLIPVITERTQTDRVRVDKLRTIAIEAAEQTERIDVPGIDEPVKISSLLSNWDTSRQIIFADESGDDETRPWGGDTGRGMAMAQALQGAGQSKAAIIIGPEGGFAPDERALLRSLDCVLPVTLGPRILRAETAIVSALTIWQSVVGDWQ